VTPAGETAYVDAIREALFEEMERDDRVFVLGEDIGVYGGAFKVTDGLLARFGEGRVIDTPISEAAIVGAAVGAAMMGMRPVAEMQFADFASCAFDMITNFAAKSRYRTGVGVPLVVRGPSGGGVHGGPFHSQNPEAYFSHTPGLKVVQPATAGDAKGLLKAAIRDDDPVIFFEHKFLYRRVHEALPAGDWIVPIGKAAVRRADPGVRRHRRGGRRPAHTLPARRGDDPLFRRQDEQGDPAARGHPNRRDRRGGRRRAGRALLRVPGRAARPGHGARHARALLAAARGVLPSECRQGLPGGEGAGRVLTRWSGEGGRW